MYRSTSSASTGSSRRCRSFAADTRGKTFRRNMAKGVSRSRVFSKVFFWRLRLLTRLGRNVYAERGETSPHIYIYIYVYIYIYAHIYIYVFICYDYCYYYFIVIIFLLIPGAHRGQGGPGAPALPPARRPGHEEYISLSIHIYIYIYTHNMCIHIYIYTHIDICIYISIYLSISLSLSIYIYIYIYIDIDI